MGEIVVLGGNGFLGACVVEACRRRGWRVHVASRRTGLDVRRPGALESYLEKVRPRMLIHCAAHVGGIAYNAQCPVSIYEDNLLIGFHVVQASARTGIQKLVNIMPNCTYPGDLDLYSEPRWWDGPMDDTVLTYGMPRKALWVQACAWRQQHGFQSIHLVLPNLYGPGDHFDVVRSHALGALIRKITDAKCEGRNSVEVWGSGNQVREWMYAEDAAEGILLAAESYSEMDILNLGCGKGCSIRQLALWIGQAANWEGELLFDSRRPDGAPKKILDVTRMRQALGGWMPPTSLNDGIRRTVNWWLEHRGNSPASADPAALAAATPGN